MKLQDLCLSIALPLLLTVAVHAQDIYKCADGDGRITYSNVPTKSCRKLVLDPVNLAPAAKAPAARRGDTSQASRRWTTDAEVARWRPPTHSRNELAAEQKNAEQAKKDLAEQEGIVLPSERMQGGAISGGKVQERMQPYKDKVALHQRNIEAIQKEIGNLR
jgi:hypothetical protein